MTCRWIARIGVLLACLSGAQARAESCATGTPEERIGCLAVQVDQLTAYVSQLQAVVAVNGNGDVVFTGTNVYVQNGSGETNSVNGKGNLIVGYGESDGTEVRTGSHNLVVGRYNEWGSFGGLIAGFHASSTAPYASVVGGRHNRARAFGSTVAGGQHNTASALYSTVVGGRDTVDGGRWMTTVGNEMDAVRGLSNFLTVDVANQAIHFDGANVYIRSGSGSTDGLVNGTGNLIVGYGEGEGTHSRTGSHNLIVGPDHSYESYGGVLFGQGNSILHDYASYSSILGGEQNYVEGGQSVVTGGLSNLVLSEWAVIDGGTNNVVGATSAVVVGGHDVSVIFDDGVTLTGGVDTEDLATQAFVTQSYATTGYVDTAVAAVEIPGLKTYLSVDAATDSVLFDGANVYVRSGSGATDGEVNGKGNLIVGYGEAPDDLQDWERAGSHNLVVGERHRYEGYAGVLFGSDNRLYGTHEAVLGGHYNHANDDMSVVVAGVDNVAQSAGVVLGGYGNYATGSYSAVVGGYYNEAGGGGTVVAGGSSNSASGDYAVVTAGSYGDAHGAWSSVIGGFGGEAVDDYSVAQ